MEYPWDTALASDKFRTEITKHIGFKVLNKGHKGKDGFQYEIGVIHEITEPLILLDLLSEKNHKNGFHYCELPIWLNRFYGSWLYGLDLDYDDNYEFWMVEILGDSLHYMNDDHVSITSKIRLIRQIKKDLTKSFDGVEDGKIESLSGDIYHIKNHMLHSEDGPAMILANGYKAWYLDNKIYRDIDTHGESWWTHDSYGYQILHRSGDLPAFIDSNGDQYWYENGEQHRSGGLPAFIGMNGDQVWYMHGKIHRLNDQPAVIRKNNSKFKDIVNTRSYYRLHFSDIPGVMEWWIDGRMQRADDKPAKITENGDMLWYQACKNSDDEYKSMLHRDDGKPAIIKANGENLWFVNGKFISRSRKIGYKIHKKGIFTDWKWNKTKTFECGMTYQKTENMINDRDYKISENPFDLFMLDSYDSDNINYMNILRVKTHNTSDMLHIESKDDIEYVEIEILGDIEYRNGDAYTDSFKVIRNITKEEILESLVDGIHISDIGDIFYIKDKKVHRTDGPAIIRNNNKTQLWFVNGLLHRSDDLPAIQYFSEDFEWINNKNKGICGQWWVNGKRHRDNDLPAVVFGDIHREWWVDGQRHRSDNKPAIIKGRVNSTGFQLSQQEWWYEGKPHRESNEPAIIKYCFDFISYRLWAINGQVHRIGDLPAIIFTLHNGISVCEEWYDHGVLHRDDDKPARICNNIDKDQTIIWTDKEWYDHGIMHRTDDKPAKIKHHIQKGQIVVMSEEWWVGGLRHRYNDLPAINRSNGYKEWYEHGVKGINPKYKQRKAAAKTTKELSGCLDKIDEKSLISNILTQDGLRQRH